MSSYYEVLGLVSSCSADEIKKAYRRLAVRWHPDKNGGSAEATEMFKTISEAYDILSDPVRRRQYDDELRMGAGSSSGVGTGSFPREGRGFDPFQHSRAAEFSHRRAQDIFESFFRDFGGTGFFDDDDLFGGPFARSGSASGHSSGFGRQNSGGGGRSTGHPFDDDPFGSMGLGGFGMRMGMVMGPSLFDRMASMHGSDMGGMGGIGGGGGAFSRSFSSSSTTMHGSGRSGKSVSTSTFIDSSGRRCTKTTTTVYHPDGSVETRSEESSDEAPSSGRLGFGGSGGASPASGASGRLVNGSGFGWRGGSPR